jgi:AraC family transcriptional regulator
MVQSEQSRAKEAPPQGTNSVSDLRGRRLLSSREWDSSGVGVYDRGEGEGLWRGDQHRLLLSLTPTSPLLVQVEGSPARDLPPTVELMSFCPAGPAVRTVGRDFRFAQVSWEPDLYRDIAPHLPAPPQFDPALTFTDPLLAQLVRTLAEEIGHGAMDRLLADSLVAALAMRVAQRFAPARPEREPDLVRPRLRRVLDYIEAHLDRELTLVELAGVACLSPCHFSRSFKQALGMGPQRYTARRRVERAKTLLRCGDEGLAVIAAVIGFADQSHFTTAFKRETGTTPGQYRAEAR